MKTVAIVGASGYTGRELLRLLARHPSLRGTAVMTARPGAEPEPPAFPHEPAIDRLDLDRLRTVDGVFLCTPHGAASDIAKAALAHGKKVVDLSADFRLRDPALYQSTYGSPHPAPGLLAEAVYGLTEHARAAVAKARLVANPGCYPTSILLPLLPLLQAGLVADAPIVADSASGTSGAGKAPGERTHFGNVHENFCAYGVGSHRHLPEIQQEAKTQRIVFTPHLLPTFRGILSTIYVTPAAGASADAMRSCLSERYAAEPFVTVYPKGGQPELRCVQTTNACHIAVTASGPLVVVTSAIDNLLKGASGQALQNMNLMLGLSETAGLQ